MTDAGALEIFVTGAITTQTRDDVSRLIQSRKGPGTVYFDTIGGDLLAGMELGRAIRRSAMATDVGRALSGSAVAPGKCHSVCTLSYAGGYYRYMQAGSQLGVHRFYRNNAGASDLDVGQVMSAAITSYLDEMGISRDLFDKMVKAGRGQMLILTNAEIARFGMANYGFKPPSWVIEGKNGAVYLKGEQESFNGMGKVLLACAPGGKVKFSALYNAGTNNQSILAGATDFTVRVNDRFLPFDGLAQKPRLSGDFIVAAFNPAPNLLAEITSATHVGFAFHGSRSETFHGFLVDKRGHNDIVGSFIQHCQSFPK